MGTATAAAIGFHSFFQDGARLGTAAGMGISGRGSAMGGTSSASGSRSSGSSAASAAASCRSTNLGT